LNRAIPPIHRCDARQHIHARGETALDEHFGETGSVEGSIQAESIDCRGRVTGSITAQQVRLYGAAHVDGDITHDQLTIETGAYFQGRSLKLPRVQTAPVEVPSIAAE